MALRARHTGSRGKQVEVVGNVMSLVGSKEARGM